MKTLLICLWIFANTVKKRKKERNTPQKSDTGKIIALHLREREFKKQCPGLQQPKKACASSPTGRFSFNPRGPLVIRCTPAPTIKLKIENWELNC